MTQEAMAVLKEFAEARKAVKDAMTEISVGGAVRTKVMAHCNGKYAERALCPMEVVVFHRSGKCPGSGVAGLAQALGISLQSATEIAQAADTRGAAGRGLVLEAAGV
jgi:hypothetical protein